MRVLIDRPLNENHRRDALGFTVTETPRACEPVEADPFIASLADRPAEAASTCESAPRVRDLRRRRRLA